jgi:hypothetical protein
MIKTSIDTYYIPVLAALTVVTNFTDKHTNDVKTNAITLELNKETIL